MMNDEWRKAHKEATEYEGIDFSFKVLTYDGTIEVDGVVYTPKWDGKEIEYEVDGNTMYFRGGNWHQYCDVAWAIHERVTGREPLL